MDGHELLKDCVGWGASLILFATLARQIWVQWKERSAEGVSRWLFVGQLLTSLGFIWYSALVGNTIFIVTNSMLVLTSVVGQCIYVRNTGLDRKMDRSEGSRPERSGPKASS